MSEIAFEALWGGIETTNGTPVAPTHKLVMDGRMVPEAPRTSIAERRGTLAARYRSVNTKRMSQLSAEGNLDAVTLPVLANMAVAPVSSPTTPSGASTTRLWTFTRVMGAKTLKTATVYDGDPNVQTFRAAYMLAKELKIMSDATGDDPCKQSVTMTGAFPVSSGIPEAVTEANPGVVTSTGHGLKNGDTVTFTAVSGMVELNGNSYTVANATANTFELSGTDTTAFTTFVYDADAYWAYDGTSAPSDVLGGMFVPADMQLWLDDTSTAFGTTEVTSSLLKAELTLPTGQQEKVYPSGPGGRRTVNGHGVGESSPTMAWTMRFDDTDEYRLFKEGVKRRIRVRLNGEIIETVTGTVFRDYVQWDITGYLESPNWADFATTNRAIEFTTIGEYDSSLGSDLRLYVQNNRATL